MNNHKIIELLVTKLPDFIFAIGIFIIFWIAGNLVYLFHQYIKQTAYQLMIRNFQ